MIDQLLSIGWYGQPGEPGTATRVHIHVAGLGPACGVKVHQDAQYQWCSWDYLETIECERCKRTSEFTFLKEGRRLAAKYAQLREQNTRRENC